MSTRESGRNKEESFIGIIRNDRFVTSSTGQIWDVEFSSCALKNGSEAFNGGILLHLIVSDVSLQGCGGPLLDVSELAKGSGPGSCPHLKVDLVLSKNRCMACIPS